MIHNVLPPNNACAGCSACAQVCAHVAITMLPDEEGFLHPRIDEQLCVDCGLCEQTCPALHPIVLNPAIKAYSGWSKDESIRLKSSSGGAFTEIARLVLENDGIVFGCALDANLTAKHIYIDKEEELERLRGSKYVQSRIGNAYKEAKRFLADGRTVLFSGTPCQIAGLMAYLRKDYQRLITVDIICHGVPSPRIFEDYKNHITQQQHFTELTDVKFRCKKSSWIFFNMTLQGYVEKNEDKQYIGTYYEDPYIRGFLRDYFLRPSCHHCQYNSTARPADFTIADWWGYKPHDASDKNFRQKGVSLLLANTQKALELTPQLHMQLRERTIEEACKTNISLSRSFPPPPLRKEFWDFYRTHPFGEVADKYMYPEPMDWAIRWLNSHPNTDRTYAIVHMLRRLRRAPKKLLKLLDLAPN